MGLGLHLVPSSGGDAVSAQQELIARTGLWENERSQHLKVREVNIASEQPECATGLAAALHCRLMGPGVQCAQFQPSRSFYNFIQEPCNLGTQTVFGVPDGFSKGTLGG